MTREWRALFTGFLCGTAFMFMGVVIWYPLKSPSLCTTSSNCAILQSPVVGDDSMSMAGRTGLKSPVSGVMVKNHPAIPNGALDIWPGEVAPNTQPSSTLIPNPFKGNPSQKFLIYSCRGRDGICGGGGDRQKGMVNAFLLATITHRRFGIMYNSPCPLTQFYVPNEYNWQIPEAELQGKSWRYVRSMDWMQTLRDDLYTIDFNQQYPEDVIFLSTNNEHHKALVQNPHYNRSLPVWAQRPVSWFFHDVWHMLMKPSRGLQARLDHHLHKLHFFNRTKPLVGFHVRIGKSSELPDVSIRNRKNKLGPVWDFVEQYVKNGSRVFLATDNTLMRNVSRERFGPAHHDIEGVILHIDSQKRHKDACQGFADLILEQLLLSRCDVIVKSRSGFSRRAVMMRGGRRSFSSFKTQT